MRQRILTALLVIITAFGIKAEYIVHPWEGKTVAYFGDSITDPRNKASDNKYWNLLKEWLGITPYVYAVSGREWNDIPRQADKLRE